MDGTSESTFDANAWPGGIATVTLIVDDLETTRKFYDDVFGVPVVYEDPECAVFKFENVQINLLRASAGEELLAPVVVARREAGTRMVFTIDIPGVDEICARLATRGVELLNGPMDRPWGVRTASFFDPGGFVWEIASPI